MRLLRRDSADSVGRWIEAAGAPRDVADAIVGTLLGCGLSPGEVREWLTHETRAYPIRLPSRSVVGKPTMMLAHTPLGLVEGGDANLVLAAAQEFAEASADERTISRLFGNDIDSVRRLTGSASERARVIAEIALTLYKRLGTPEKVCYVGQTRLPGYADEVRIVDRLLAREEAAVAAELADGRIDARELERTGELIFTGW